MQRPPTSSRSKQTTSKATANACAIGCFLKQNLFVSSCVRESARKNSGRTRRPRHYRSPVLRAQHEV
jgi:hypothetical protein